MSLSEKKLNEYTQRLGKQIRAYRKAAKLSQPQLAEMAGINSKFLGEVERGKSTLTVSRLMQIASALQISITTLLEPLASASSPISKNELLQLIESDLQNFSEEDLFILYRLSSFIKYDKGALHNK